MSSKSLDPRLYAIPLLLLLVLSALLWWAPQERTLGGGITIVYVHVASMWVGLTWFVVICGLGVALVAFGRERPVRVAQILVWMAVGWYGVGLAASLLAAKINWGGVYWAEPRMAMSLRCMIVGLLAATLALWIERPRWLGGIVLLPPLYLLWSLWQTPLVLHPRNPIGGDGASSIRLTFLGTYLLLLALAAWMAWWLSRRLPRQTA